MPRIRHHCPKCGSTWLDNGELVSIRALFPDEESLRQARTEAVQLEMKADFEYLQKRTDEAAHLGRFRNLLAWLKTPDWQ